MGNRSDELVKTFIEVKLDHPDDFLVVKETLSRMGSRLSPKVNTILQNCYILHKKQKFYIVHYKELMQLDGSDEPLTLDEIAHRNSCAVMLARWGLLAFSSTEQMDECIKTKVSVTVIPYKKKADWNIVQTYKIGE